MLPLYWAIDQIPRLRRSATGEYGTNTLRRIARIVPERSAAEHAAIMRAFLRHRLLNRLIYRLTMYAPSCAAFASRLIPVGGVAHMAHANAHDGPIIVAAGHFGSLYFQSFIAARLLRGRRMYIMHGRKFADGQRDEAFLRRLGIVPVAADAQGLRTLVRALNDSARTAIVLPFDAPIGHRLEIDFLMTQIPVSTGLGFLADIRRCPVVPWFWQIEHGRPSIVIGPPVSVDLELPTAARRIAMVETLYAMLEQRVARFPEQWHLDFIREADVRKRRDEHRRPVGFRARSKGIAAHGSGCGGAIERKQSGAE